MGTLCMYYFEESHIITCVWELFKNSAETIIPLSFFNGDVTSSSVFVLC